jgi:hypothetical protein
MPLLWNEIITDRRVYQSYSRPIKVRTSSTSTYWTSQGNAHTSGPGDWTESDDTPGTATAMEQFGGWLMPYKGELVKFKTIYYQGTYSGGSQPSWKMYFYKYTGGNHASGTLMGSADVQILTFRGYHLVTTTLDPGAAGVDFEEGDIIVPWIRQTAGTTGHYMYGSITMVACYNMNTMIGA